MQRTEISPTIRKGDIVDVKGKPCKVVGFRGTIKGEILDEPAPRFYPVFVEQSGDYRMFTLNQRVPKVSNVASTGLHVRYHIYVDGRDWYVEDEVKAVAAYNELGDVDKRLYCETYKSKDDYLAGEQPLEEHCEMSNGEFPW